MHSHIYWDSLAFFEPCRQYGNPAVWVSTEILRGDGLHFVAARLSIWASYRQQPTDKWCDACLGQMLDNTSFLLGYSPT